MEKWEQNMIIRVQFIVSSSCVSFFIFSPIYQEIIIKVILENIQVPDINSRTIRLLLKNQT